MMRSAKDDNDGDKVKLRSQWNGVSRVLVDLFFVFFCDIFFIYMRIVEFIIYFVC